MERNRLVTATIVGGIVLFFVGYLIFNLAFGSFYAANAGSATGVDRDVPLMWAIALGSLAQALLIAYFMGNRAGVLTLGQAAGIGALVSFLMWFAADFTLYGVTNVSNLTRTVVDPLLEIVHGGIGGAAIGAVLRRGARS